MTSLSDIISFDWRGEERIQKDKGGGFIGREMMNLTNQKTIVRYSFNDY